jgi:hypothetical protein
MLGVMNHPQRIAALLADPDAELNPVDRARAAEILAAAGTTRPTAAGDLTVDVNGFDTLDRCLQTSLDHAARLVQEAISAKSEVRAVGALLADSDQQLRRLRPSKVAAVGERLRVAIEAAVAVADALAGSRRSPEDDEFGAYEGDQIAFRTQCACDQLQRYGGAVHSAKVLDVLEHLTDLNDDLCNGRAETTVRKNVETIKKALDKLVDE